MNHNKAKEKAPRAKAARGAGTKVTIQTNRQLQYSINPPDNQYYANRIEEPEYCSLAESYAIELANIPTAALSAELARRIEADIQADIAVLARICRGDRR